MPDVGLAPPVAVRVRAPPRIAGERWVSPLLRRILLVNALPLALLVAALLYLDLRIRREGLDVGLVRAAQARAVGRAR